MKGEPYQFLRGHVARVRHPHERPLGERFWEKVDKESSPHGCWLWTAGKSKDGYGIMKDGPAHRLSYEMHVGPIPNEMHVCHNCPGGDNPSCVNPQHLFLGTQTENVLDMYRKGRDNKSRGADHYLAKVTDDDVREIRRIYKRYDPEFGATALAKRYGIRHSSIIKIALRQTWAHID